ncbi:MAG TPA: hypothetical protein VNI79_06960 [Sphingomicrobium sp.]|nr:hypothetical protein [Sphingomicrobium sp.]
MSKLLLLELDLLLLDAGFFLLLAGAFLVLLFGDLAMIASLLVHALTAKTVQRRNGSENAHGAWNAQR